MTSIAKYLESTNSTYDKWADSERKRYQLSKKHNTNMKITQKEWSLKHKDYKGSIDGKKSMLFNDNGATKLIFVDIIEDVHNFKELENESYYIKN